MFKIKYCICHLTIVYKVQNILINAKACGREQKWWLVDLAICGGLCTVPMWVLLTSSTSSGYCQLINTARCNGCLQAINSDLQIFIQCSHKKKNTPYLIPPIIKVLTNFTHQFIRTYRQVNYEPLDQLWIRTLNSEP